MSVSLPSIGLSGIAAAEAAMAAIESNITNASNPDYSVESVGFQTVTGPNGAGAGVEVGQTTRATDPLLTNQINDSQGQQSYDQAFSEVTTLAQQIVAPSTGDLSTALQNVFNAFTALSANPQDSTTRTSALNALSQFAQTDQNMSSNLYSTAVTQLDSVSPLISQINAASSQIAQLNSQITAAGAAGQSTATLEDQRDSAVNQLAGLVGATADANGNVSVGGVPLVSGNSALTLSMTGSGTSIGLEVSLANGMLPLNVNQVGGQLGGVMAGAQATLNLQSQVNNFASTVAGALNNVSTTGYGLDGSTGNAVFVIPGGNDPIAINPDLTEQNLPAASTGASVPGDGSNAVAMAAVASSQNLFAADPTNTPSEELTQTLSNFGTLVQNAGNGQTQAANTLQSLTQMKSQVTGVSLNDQLTELLQYQNMLQASGRAVQAACDDITFLIQNISS
ncbi:MAG TPA: flagellar hook-associated protein FlgK [Candidatus Binataceae bacterium]|nr:flagellar hook-associated protein FlgK [Candidatus Binataceae bacterium]